MLDKLTQSDPCEQEAYTAEEIAEMEAAAAEIDHTWCYCQNRLMSQGGCLWCHEDK